MEYTKPHTLEEWIAWYEEKTGDQFTVKADAALYVHPKRGVMVCRITNDMPDSKMLVIDYVAGDGRFWHDFAEVVAGVQACRCIATICTRHVESYIRFWGYKIVQSWDKDGKKRYLAKEERQGRYALLTYRGIDERTDKDTYWVTEYLHAGDKPAL